MASAKAYAGARSSTDRVACIDSVVLPFHKSSTDRVVLPFHRPNTTTCNTTALVLKELWWKLTSFSYLKERDFDKPPSASLRPRRTLPPKKISSVDQVLNFLQHSFISDITGEVVKTQKQTHLNHLTIMFLGSRFCQRPPIVQTSFVVIRAVWQSFWGVATFSSLAV